MKNIKELKGRCSFCNKIFLKSQIVDHLKLCPEREKMREKMKAKLKKQKIFYIWIESSPIYWMYIALPANFFLKNLDSFLRDVWLECCYHLSEFEINNIFYQVTIDDEDFLWYNYNKNKLKDMNIPLDSVLTPKTEFYYKYDFGSTTELTLNVLSEQEEISEKRIIILARNELPEVFCSLCGKTATKVCPICYQYDEGWFCDACVKKHGCVKEGGIGIILPIVNSPRVGVCGYRGPTKNIEKQYYPKWRMRK